MFLLSLWDFLYVFTAFTTYVFSPIRIKFHTKIGDKVNISKRCSFTGNTWNITYHNSLTVLSDLNESRRLIYESFCPVHIRSQFDPNWWVKELVIKFVSFQMTNFSESFLSNHTVNLWKSDLCDISVNL